MENDDPVRIDISFEQFTTFAFFAIWSYCWQSWAPLMVYLGIVIMHRMFVAIMGELNRIQDRQIDAAQKGKNGIRD